MSPRSGRRRSRLRPLEFRLGERHRVAVEPERAREFGRGFDQLGVAGVFGLLRFGEAGRMRHALADSVCSLPPCGGGLGRGVEVRPVRTRLAQQRTAHRLARAMRGGEILAPVPRIIRRRLQPGLRTLLGPALAAGKRLVRPPGGLLRRLFSPVCEPTPAVPLAMPGLSSFSSAGAIGASGSRAALARVGRAGPWLSSSRAVWPWAEYGTGKAAREGRELFRSPACDVRCITKARISVASLRATADGTLLGMNSSGGSKNAECRGHEVVQG